MEGVTPGGAERVRRELSRWCDDATSAHQLFEGVSRRLQPLLGFEAAAWLVTDPASMLFMDALVEGFPPEACSPWYHQELAVPQAGTFRELALARRPVSILSETTGGELSHSPRWRDLLEPLGHGDELRVVFRAGNACWGAAALHRRSTSPGFGAAEADLLEGVSPLIAQALRRVVWCETRGQPTGPDHPGLVLVGADGVPRPATESGERWLELLALNENGRRHTVLLTLGELASQEDRVRRVRLSTPDGAWATLHAEPMTGSDGFAVIIEPSRPGDIAAVAAQAYGLSPRETELLLAVARGEGTNAIAARMFISPHTVRDHLKAIFDKTGVSSRSELVGRLFHDHYADRAFAQGASHV